MKQLLLIFCFSFFSINIGFCQWPAVFGTEYYWATPNHTRETYDKGFLQTLDFEPQPNTPYGSCVIKIDINGNQLWKKQIGNSSKHLEIKGLAFDLENNIYISGGTAQFDNQRDPFIMKLNPCMEIEWCNIYRTPDLDDLANEINFIPALNSLMVNLIYVRAENNISIMNIDTNGTKIWENFYCTSPELTGSLPVGIVNSTIDSSTLLYGFAYVLNDTASYYELSPYWSKIDYNGTVIWEKFRLPDSSFSRGVTREEPVFQNQSTISGLNSCPPDNNSQLVQLNYVNGDFEWIKTLHQPDTVNVCVLNASAKFNNNIYTGVQYFKTGYDAIGCGSLQKNDSSGNFITEAILPANFTSVIEDICITSDNKLLISATHSLLDYDVMLIKYTQNLEYDSINTTPIIYDSLCPYNITSGLIELNCNVVTGIFDNSKKVISSLKIFPNPSHDYCVIQLPETIETGTRKGLIDVTTFRSDYVNNLFLEITNLFGQSVYSTTWPDNSKEQVISISGWDSGLYFIKIRNNSRIILTGKLLVN